MKLSKILSLLFFILIISCSEKQTIASNQVVEYKFDELEDFAKKSPGIAVLIVKNGQTILKNGYGLANLENKTSITSDTVFETGSVSKMFTAGAIINLIDDGKIKLDESANKYLPKDFAFLPKNIKIRNLIFHTSGIPDYLNDKSLNLHKKVNSGELIGNDFVLNYLKHSKIKTKEINKAFNYSNTNYVLLSIIIENVSQIKYDTFLKMKLFEPNNMQSFVNTPNRQIGENESTSYGEWPHFKPLKNKINYITTGDFGLQLSLNDFEKWIKFISSNKQYWDKYNTHGKVIAKNKRTEDIDYGYGMRFGKINGLDCIFHRGYISGASNIFAYSKELNTFVVILSNTSSTFTDNIAGYIFGVMRDSEKQTRS